MKTNHNYNSGVEHRSERLCVIVLHTVSSRKLFTLKCIIHSFTQQTFSAYSILGTALRPEDPEINKLPYISSSYLLNIYIQENHCHHV